MSNAKIFRVHDGGETFAFAGLDAESVLAHFRLNFDPEEPADSEVEGPMPNDRCWTVADEDGSTYWSGDSVSAIDHFVGRDLNPGEAVPMWSSLV